MDTNIGTTVFLKGDFIKKIVKNYAEESRSFKIIAMTDVAVGLKNIKSGRTYTVATVPFYDNIDKSASSKTGMPKKTAAKRVIDLNPGVTPPVTPTPVVPPPVIPAVPGPGFEFVSPVSTGGVKIKATAITNGIVEVVDDPFGDLYG